MDLRFGMAKLPPPDFDSKRSYPLIHIRLRRTAAKNCSRCVWMGNMTMWHILHVQQRGFIHPLSWLIVDKAHSLDTSCGRSSIASTGEFETEIQRRCKSRPCCTDGAISIVPALVFGGLRWRKLKTSIDVFRYPKNIKAECLKRQSSNYLSTQSIKNATHGYRVTIEKLCGIFSITHASQSRGNLLLVHGTGDWQRSLPGVSDWLMSLFKQNKHLTLMIYRIGVWNSLEGEGTSLHINSMRNEILRGSICKSATINYDLFRLDSPSILVIKS